MAARSSFNKRQKEAARREKRQIKLDRRQGRQPVDHGSPDLPKNDEEPATSVDTNDPASTTAVE
jgi:hypothetical protein